MNIHLADESVICVTIEKVACSSIRYALGKHLGVDQPQHWPHHWPFPRMSSAAVLARSNCYRFAFVRNPYDRLVSCWAHKVRRHLGQQAHCPLWPELSSSTSFPDFVAWVSSHDPETCDRHFRPQWTFLESAGNLIVDDLLPFERLSETWSGLADRFGWPKLSRRNVTAHPHYRELFTRQVRKHAEKFYRRDFDLLRYRF